MNQPKPFSLDKNNLAMVTYNAMLNNDYEQIYFKDLASRFILLSKRQATCLGLDRPEEAIGKTDFDFFSNIHAQQAYNDEQRIIATGTPILNKVELETWEVRSNNYVITSKYPLLDADNHIIGTWGHTVRIEDLQHSKEGIYLKSVLIEASETINYNTKTDPLTSLPNAKAFFNAMNLTYQKTMSQLAMEGKDHALILVDIEGFKVINEEYGSDCGNAALTYMANLLNAIIPSTDSDDKLFMYGTNSFAIITDITHIDDAVNLSNDVLNESLKQPFQYDASDILLMFNIGLCSFKEVMPQGTIYDIINLADGRLSEAKQNGSNNIIYKRK